MYLYIYDTKTYLWDDPNIAIYVSLLYHVIYQAWESPPGSPKPWHLWHDVLSGKRCFSVKHFTSPRYITFLVNAIQLDRIFKKHWNLSLDLQIQTWWLESFVIDICAATFATETIQAAKMVSFWRLNMTNNIYWPDKNKLLPPGKKHIPVLFPRLVSPMPRFPQALQIFVSSERRFGLPLASRSVKSWWRKTDEKIWKVDV